MTPATVNQNALFKALMLDEPYERFRCVLFMPHLTPIRDPVVGEWCRTKYLVIIDVRTLIAQVLLDFAIDSSHSTLVKCLIKKYLMFSGLGAWFKELRQNLKPFS